MNAMNRIERVKWMKFLLLTYNRIWMKYVLVTLVNWINELPEIEVGSTKTTPHFKRVSYNKIFFIQNPYENPNERKKIEFL